MKTTTGHLLIGWEHVKTGELRTHITPATFSGNGLALHAEIDDAKRWVIAHVSSGLKLRGYLKKREAMAMLKLLADTDWTFAKDAVTQAHATLVREAFEKATGASYARSAA